MNVFVVNSGSSSIKFSVYGTEVGHGGVPPKSVCEGEVTGLGGPAARFRFVDAAGNHRSRGQTEVQARTATEAIQVVMNAVLDGGMLELGAVGYRVVHPGTRLKGHVRVTPEVLQDLEAAAEFAPLHDPAAVEVIRAVMQRLQAIPHFVCFDTVFHETMGEAATTYALPEEVRHRGVRRYGFHGLSCESIVRQIRAGRAGVGQAGVDQAGVGQRRTQPMAAQANSGEPGGMTFPNRMVIAHLGSGCSVTAVVDGRSVDTTMGLTPTGGVVMGTRPGDLDPGLMLYLLRQQEGGKEEAIMAVEGMMNHNAGVVALSGMANDMKAVRQAAKDGDPRALLAIEVFVRSIRKAIGSFAWLMGGVDAIIFAGGIGEHDAASRQQILAGLEQMGIVLDAVQNENSSDGIRKLSPPSSRVDVYVVPAEEDRMISVHVLEMM